MYKSMITFIAAVLILTACSNGNAANPNTEMNATGQQELQETTDKNQEQHEAQEQSAAKEQDEDQEQSEDASDFESEAANDSNSDAADEKWSALEEYATIITQIGDEDYAFTMTTDSKDKRILLLEKDGVKKYKTIYLKHKDRLKIISLDGDKEIYNEVIGAQ